MMYKVVYNACYGGFVLSDEAQYWLKSRGAEFASWFRDIPRHHPLLVECVEALGADASGFCSNLVLREVNGPYRITEYDGYEEVLEPDSPHDWIDPSELAGRWECGAARLAHRHGNGRDLWQGQLTSRWRSTVAEALSDVGAPPCPVDDSGWPVEESK